MRVIRTETVLLEKPATKDRLGLLAWRGRPWFPKTLAMDILAMAEYPVAGDGERENLCLH